MDFDNNQQHVSLQLLIFILSLADDALLLLLSRIGFHFTWLRWLSPVIIVGMVVHFAWHFLRHKIKSHPPIEEQNLESF